MNKLEDISRLIGSGLTPLRSNNLFWNKKEIPWLKTEQLGQFIIYDTNEYISKYALDKTSIKLFPKNTISIAMYGEGKTRGNVSILGNEMCSNQACCNIVVDESQADYRYVYYWLKNNYLNLRNLAVGVRKNLNSDDIKKFEIDLKTLPIQKQIADLLYYIDSKIENNNMINSELESIAKTLYDYWFLQFEFPNAECKPYKSSGGKMVYNEQLKKEIPEGWEVLKVKDLLDVVTGKEDSNFATDNGKYKFFTCSSEVLNCDNYAFDGKAVLLAGNGDFNVKHYQGKFNAYQRTYVLIPNDETYFGSIYMATDKLVKRFKAGSNGSIVKFITKGDVENIEILNPVNKDLLEPFNKILSLIEKNNEENQELASLRDFLLPLLMNGQVTIKDEEEELENQVQQAVVLTYIERFAKWKQAQGYAARGDVDDEILKKIFDAMEEDDKK